MPRVAPSVPVTLQPGLGQIQTELTVTVCPRSSVATKTFKTSLEVKKCQKIAIMLKHGFAGCAAGLETAGQSQCSLGVTVGKKH